FFAPLHLLSFPTRRSSDLVCPIRYSHVLPLNLKVITKFTDTVSVLVFHGFGIDFKGSRSIVSRTSAEEKQFDHLDAFWFEFLHRSEEHTSELQSRENLVCR